MKLEKSIAGFQGYTQPAQLIYNTNEKENTDIDGIVEYGICVHIIFSDGKTMSESVNGITPNKTEIESLTQFLFDNSIYPSSLKYIVEDILSA